nr:MAG TPA: hypothetical protein [Caudoviricetes sp.]
MIDGYAFIDSWFQAVVVIEESVTKADFIKWGWAVEEKYLNKRDAENAVRNGKAFEKGGKYYRLNVSGNKTSRYEYPYWTGAGVTDPFALDLITAALSAPVAQQVARTPYYGHWLTAGGERVDMTLWRHRTNERGEVTQEWAKIPGVGYEYPLNTFHEDKPVGEWPRYPDGFPWITIHMPNCEISPHTCISLRVEAEEEPITHHFTSTRLIHMSTFFPKKIRRLPMPRYQPRTTTESISCYVMTRPLVKNFIDNLYSKDIYDKVQQMLYGDGANNLLSLKWFYGVRPSITTARTSKITLGNVVVDKVTAPVYNGDFVQVYMGYTKVDREYEDYRDYTNVRYQAYIPMVGVIDLDPAQVVGKYMHLLYTVNLTDGSAVVTLAISNLVQAGKPVLPKTNEWYDTPQIVFTSSITYGYEIPLNVESIRSASLMVGEVIAKAVVGGVAGAIAGNIPGAVIGAVGGAVGGALDGGVQSAYSAGALTANSNVMGDFTPKLIRTITKDVSGDIAPAVGSPSGKVVRVGDASGYLKAAMVYGTPSTTMQHTDEIVNMLKEGIYIS